MWRTVRSWEGCCSGFLRRDEEWDAVPHPGAQEAPPPSVPAAGLNASRLVLLKKKEVLLCQSD